MRARLLLLSVGLVGFGPFMCDQPDVETARQQIKAAEAEPALATLAEVAADAPEVHHARALAYIAQEKWDEANSSLDQALRGIAERDARDSAERAEEGLEPLPLSARPSADLRGRVLFARGLVAIGQERWEDALVEFAQVLGLDPDDEDARWNMELAWHRANPPCVQRDDDREPDDTRAEAKPIDQETPEVTERRLCPGDEDWHVVEGQRDMILFATLTGELEPFEEEETREVTLSLFGPGDETPLRTAPLKDGKALVGVTGLDRDGQYHLQVAGPGMAEVSYGLKIEIVPPCPADDRLEDNDTVTDAKPLEEGDTPGLKACPGDADWYTVKVPKGEKRQLQVGFDPDRAPLAVERFDALGQVAEDVGRGAQGGMVLNLPSDDENDGQFLVRVTAMSDRENTYSLKLAPPEDNSGDNQDQQDQNEDENQDEDQNEDQNEDQQDQQDQQDQGEQPPPEPQPQEIDLDKLIDALDEHPKNPQLEKAMRELRVVPRMEDY